MSVLFANLETGATVEEFLEWFPQVKKWQVMAVLSHAAGGSLPRDGVFQHIRAPARILLDQGTPAGLRHHLPGYSVDTPSDRDWESLDNDALIVRAEASGYKVLVTTDKSMRNEQNLAGKQLAVVVLMAQTWEVLRPRTAAIRAAIEEARPGEFREVPIPLKHQRNRPARPTRP